MNITKTLLFLLIKCENLCNAKDSHILSTKNNRVFAYAVGIYLTSSLNDDQANEDLNWPLAVL